MLDCDRPGWHPARVSIDPPESPRSDTPPSPREVELKLDLQLSDHDRLHALLRRKRLGVPEIKALRSVYYDTPELALAEAGFTLRVRDDKGRLVQTTKSGEAGSAGLFDREEWEQEVAGPGPDLAVAERTPAGRLLRRKRVRRAIDARFEVLVTRSIWRVTRKGTTFELSLDRGEVRCGEETDIFCECELELKEGLPGPLFEFARDLNRTVPLRLGVRSKAERGCALVRGDRSIASKAEPPALERSMSTSQVFRAITGSCLRHFRLNEPQLARAEPEVLHQARVALRRLRSALTLFKPMIADAQLEAMRPRLHAVSQQLGSTRDLDVFISGVLEREVEDTGYDTTLEALVAAAERRREQAYADLDRTLASEAFRDLMLEFAGWLACGPWSVSDDAAVSARREEMILPTSTVILDRRWRTVRRKGKRLTKLSAEQRHRVRIATKTLRYAMDFLAPLFGRTEQASARRKTMTALTDLQEALGQLNDITAGEKLNRELAEEAGASVDAELRPATDVILASQNEQMAELLDAARSAHKRLSGGKPFWRKDRPRHTAWASGPGDRPG